MDIPANYLCISRQPNSYLNVVPRESSDAEADEEEVTTNELDILIDHEIRDLIVSPDALIYDQTKSIKQTDLELYHCQ